jgi:hypothetical protein
MRQQLTSVGMDVGIVLDDGLRAALKVSPHDEVDVEVQDDKLVVRAVRDEHHDPVAAAFRDVLDHSDEIVKRTRWIGRS